MSMCYLYKFEKVVVRNLIMYVRFPYLDHNKQGVVAHVCSPSTWEVQTGGSGVVRQPGLLHETLSQNTEQRESTSPFPAALTGFL